MDSHLKRHNPISLDVGLTSLYLILCFTVLAPSVFGLGEKSGPAKAQAPALSPAFLDSVPPVYPAIARKAKMEGTVVVQATIGASGVLLEAKIQKGVNPLLNKAALDALRLSTFSPAISEGKACSGELFVSYTFDLDLNYRETVIREKPPIDWTRPLVSDLGQLVETRGSGQGEFGVYSFRGLTIYGNMSVGLLDTILAVVRPRLAPGEEIISVRHPLVYQEFGGPGYLESCDLEVSTCTRRNSDGGCSRGKSYPFENRNGVYSLSLPKGQSRMWIP